MPHVPTTQSEPNDLIRQEQVRRNQAAIQLPQSWTDLGDEHEQRETLAYLKQAIDENRFTRLAFLEISPTSQGDGK